jgi:hypothetical protein
MYPTLAYWAPEQDLSQDTMDIEPSARIVEERGRSTFIRRDDDL